MAPPCKPGCTCRRHTRPRPKCQPGCTCKRHTIAPEVARRVGDKLRGVPKTAEHNRRVSEALTGRKLSPEHIASIKTHGRSRDPNYFRHAAMMARCYNPNSSAYEFYGARGIGVHEPWYDVATFCDWIAANLGPCPPGHSLDRIDNDRGYEPGNVRWATQSVQVVNRRRIARVRPECAVCGSPFVATRSDAKHCSARCHSTAQRRRERARR